MTRASGKSEGLRMLVPGGLFALAVAVRALPWRTVLSPDGVHVAANDAWYHLRRIAWSIANPPHVLDFDPFLHFPAGATPIWSPAFDGVVAALLGLWVAPGDSDALERAAVWVPPLLGGLGVVALYLIARRHFGGSVAALAGLVLALLPAHFWYSRIGYVDHHVAVALTATLALGAALSLVAASAPSPAGEGSSRGVGAALALGACLAAMLLVWPGALLHAGLLELTLVAHAVGQASGRRAAAAAARFALAHALAFALVLPFCLGNRWPQWGDFSPLVLSGFQPWWLGALALGAGLSGLSWTRTETGRSAASRAAVALGLGAGILGASALLWPGLTTALGDAIAWLLRTDAFQARVAESQPLLFSAGAFDPEPAIVRLSLFVLLLPFVVPWIWRRAGGRPEAARVRVVVAWSLGLGVATLLQRRFFHSFAVGEALLIGWCWVELGSRLTARPTAGQGAARRPAIVVGLGVALALLLLPSVASYRSFLATPAPGEPLPVSPTTMRRRTAEALATWLRENTPPVSGWLERDAAPEYGVLAPWDVGHVIHYRGRRPTVVDNFGDDLGPENFERAARYFASAEPEALAILDSLRVRYVVTGPGVVASDAPGPGSMLRALLVRDGSSGVGERGAPALERHRLVWESPSLAPRDRDAPPVYKVFAVVPGARIEGRAAPGTGVELELALRTARGRPTGYRATTTGDGEGSFAFRVPHAAPGGTPGVLAPGPYRLRCGDEQAEVRVDEAAIASGATIRVPDVCP